MKVVRIIGLVILFIVAGVWVFTLIDKDDEPEVEFHDLTVTYDGEYHELLVSNLTDDMVVYYENKETLDEFSRYKDVGVYPIRAFVFKNNKEYKSLEATLKIVPRQAVITMDEIIIKNGERLPKNYTIDGVVSGDELEVWVGFKDDYTPYVTWENKNYDVILIGGRVKKIDTLVNSIDEYSFDKEHLYIDNSLLPVAFKDTSYFENKTITSISFVFGGFISDYNPDELDFYVYVVDKDFTRKKEECTLENGKKVVVDVKDFIENRIGNVVTITGLNIEVGEGETLVFGDSDMQFYIYGYESDSSYPLVRNVFEYPIDSMHSVAIAVEGSWYLGGDE